ncbi:PAS domain-containing protein [Streptomyces sp. TRM 70351]|uniref:response regulator n=1 Tax=Streptomyces sp. TRM 70351 TaxID=3116552 RepID=UPI002E7ABF65|nr:PAS domain-containing protein [Streptomyces sp. TRM 70351]MEE1930186.1 PAS domain-containing protein [Streptomyces sp. TRM 70351]
MSSRPSRGAARLAAILDALPDALLLVNANGTVVNANSIALEVFEAPGTALIGRGLLDLLPAFDSKRIPGSMRRPDEQVEGRTPPTRMIARRIDGAEFPVEVTSANLEDGRTTYESPFEAAYADHGNSYTGNELLMLVVRDLTGTLDTEAELARQQRQTEMILRAAAEGVIGTDTEGRVVLVNPAAATILGYRASDLGGQQLHPLVHHSRADGSPLPYEETPLADTLRSGRKHRVRSQVLWAKDGRPVPVDITTAPVRDGDQLVGAVITFTDRRALDSLEARHEQLLAVVNDALRGPLDELRRQLGGLAADPAGQLWPEANQVLHYLSAGYTRMTTLMDNVMSFQRLETGQDALERKQVALDAVISAGVEGAVELIGPGRAQFAVHAPPVQAVVDPDRLALAVAHLIADVAGVDATGNATAGGGDSTIVVAAAKRGGDAAVARIEVRGPHGGGSPVHLPVVRGIVRLHGGVLQTHEVPGGSAYVLEVPLGDVDESLVPERKPEAAPAAPGAAPVPGQPVAETPTGRRARRALRPVGEESDGAGDSVAGQIPQQVAPGTGRRGRRARPGPEDGAAAAAAPRRAAFALPPAAADRAPETEPAAPDAPVPGTPVPGPGGPGPAAPGTGAAPGAPVPSPRVPGSLERGTPGSPGPRVPGSPEPRVPGAHEPRVPAPHEPPRLPVPPGAHAPEPGAGGASGPGMPHAPEPGVPAGAAEPAAVPQDRPTGRRRKPAPPQEQAPPVPPREQAHEPAQEPPGAEDPHAGQPMVARSPILGGDAPYPAPHPPQAPQPGQPALPAPGAEPPADSSSGGFSVRTLGQGLPFGRRPGETAPEEAEAPQPVLPPRPPVPPTPPPDPSPASAQGAPAVPSGSQPAPATPPAGTGRRRKLATPPAEGERERTATPPPERAPERQHVPEQPPAPPHRTPHRPAGPAPAPGAAQGSAGPAPSAASDGLAREFAIGAPAAGAAEGPEPLDGPNGAVEVTDSGAGTPPRPRDMDDELPPEPLDNPRRLLVWPEPDVSTQQALTDRGYRPVLVHSREEVDAQMAAYPAALFVDPLTGPITRTALQSLRQAAVAAEVPVLVTAGLGQASREAAYGADPAVLLKALAPRDSEQHPPRVLLVEEQAAIAEAFTATLERRGMQVTHASSDSEAAALAAQLRPNLVVMDLCQIRRRRAGVIDWLRVNGHLNRTPFVVYTSARMEPAELDLLASGETVLFLAERSTSAEVQGRIVDLLAKIGAN